MSIEFVIGWIFIRDEMKAISKSIFDEGKIILGPIQDAIKALWVVVSNPWKILGYALFISLVRIQPETWNEMISAAQKGQKLQ